MELDVTRKLTGILVPVFALRSETDLGIGDTECMREMVEWCARHNFSVFQVLPIYETGDDHSPYNAISSLAIDPTTITVTPKRIADLSVKDFETLASPELLKELRKGPVIYRKVKSLKLQLLRKAFDQFLKEHDSKNTDRAKIFRAFVITHKNWIEDYALFRTLMHLHQDMALWEQWPLEHRTPNQARNWMLSLPVSQKRELEESIRFFSYVQWIAHQQWSDLKHYSEQHGVSLMGDIPFGISRHSADIWAYPALFDLQWSGGAPPEKFFKPDLFTESWGQNWGVPLYRWDRMKEDHYAWWRTRIQGSSRFFHFFRIDHVLGFYRIYAFPWRPEENHLYINLSHEQAHAKAGALPRFWPGSDDDPHQRWINQQHGEELLRMMIEAAGKTGVIAEDLGMVPDYMRPSLTQLGIPGFKIPLFERHPDGSYKNSNEYPPLSVTTPGTHDHEPLAAIWNRWQTATEGPSEISHFLRWIGWNPDHPPREYTQELHLAIIQKLLICPSWLVIFMITDLFAQTQRFNIPGPMSNSNWTERLDLPINQFDHHSQIKPLLRALKTYLPRK